MTVLLLPKKLKHTLFLKRKERLTDPLMIAKSGQAVHTKGMSVRTVHAVKAEIYVFLVVNAQLPARITLKRFALYWIKPLTFVMVVTNLTPALWKRDFTELAKHKKSMKK